MNNTVASNCKGFMKLYHLPERQLTSHHMSIRSRSLVLFLTFFNCKSWDHVASSGRMSVSDEMIHLNVLAEDYPGRYEERRRDNRYPDLNSNLGPTVYTTQHSTISFCARNMKQIDKLLIAYRRCSKCPIVIFSWFGNVNLERLRMITKRHDSQQGWLRPSDLQQLSPSLHEFS
jgi:hypothetical protein